MAENYYDILGVAKNASDSEIKRAYRRLAQKHHPDRNKGHPEAEKKFKEINNAYEILSDPKKRAQYNQFGENPPGFGQGQGGYQTAYDFSSFGGFSDIFETFFGQGQRRSSGRKRKEASRGNDIESNLQISFEEAIFGCEKTLEITKPETCGNCQGKGHEPGTKIIPCPDCQGTGEIRTIKNTILGQIATNQTCDKCYGEGRIPERKCSVCQGSSQIRKTETIKVKIPGGINEGSTIRLREKGEAGLFGGQKGDLYIYIRVGKSPKFIREGFDISSEQKVDLLQVVLGDQIDVETVYGKIKMELPAGTQSGKVFKIKEQGVIKLRDNTKGDHYVKIMVNIPSKLNKKEKKLYEELALEKGLNLHPKEGFFDRLI